MLLWGQNALAQPPIQTGLSTPRAGSEALVKPNPSGSSQSPQQSGLSLGQGEGGSKSASVFDRLVREIDNMVPGDLDKNPDRKKMVQEAIKAFQDRNAERTVEIFDQMTTSNPYLPPTDLLLASLSFIISDPTTGKILLERAASEHPENLGISAAFSRCLLYTSPSPRDS